MRNKKGFINIIVLLVVLSIIGASSYYIAFQNKTNPFSIISSKQSKKLTTNNQPVPTKTTILKSTQSITNTTHPPIAPSAPIKFNSCIEINKPGKYILGKDIKSLNGENCIKIHDTTNVEVDCSNHSISADIGLNAVSINKVKDFTITSCVFKNKTINPPQDAWSGSVAISHSQNGTITKNTFSLSTFGSINNSSFIKVIDNNMFSQLLINSSKYTLLQNNNFIFTPNNKQKKLGVLLNITNGSNNKIIKNTFNGGWDGVLRNEDSDIGSDDSINISYENSDTLQDNIIKNNWDCGIETAGFLFDSKIINNNIQNSGLCAIGGWYNNSLRGDLLKNNIGGNVPSLFYFYRTYKLKPNEQYVYFKDNLFENNRLINPRLNTSSPASLFEFNSPDIPTKDYILGNNIFKNNDFTKTAEPLLITPDTMIVDGGENICSGINGKIKQNRKTPINCN